MTDVAIPVPSRLQQLRERSRVRTVFAALGPAFVACIAYVDPGNFATNIAGGAKYGYLLLWVLLSANLMAMLIQNLSAKIGIATGRNLPELCREHFRRPVSWGLWVQAELIALATDLAEPWEHLPPCGKCADYWRAWGGRLYPSSPDLVEAG